VRAFLRTRTPFRHVRAGLEVDQPQRPGQSVTK
jgi:hypothetical protein